jgi:nucleotide-binding universal stress UspA family protein
MTKILIPIDFSTTSINALRYALQLFKNNDTEFTIIHTYRTSSTAFHMKSMDRVLKKDGEDQMQSLIKRIKSDYPIKTIHHKVIKGDAIDVTLSRANSGDFDLIIMGTKGASGLQEVFIGSVAGEVIARSSIPVMVIPHEYEFTPLQKIVLAIENPVLNEETLDPLKLFSNPNSKTHLLHITRDLEPTLFLDTAGLKFIDPEIINYSCDKDINTCIEEFIEQNSPNILGLIRSNKGFFTRLYSGSVTLSQTFHSTIPLLILKEQ